MADIVGGFATSHAPGITGFPERADSSQAQAIHAAFGAARDQIADARPDALVVVSVEHFTNFFLNNYPAMAIGTADEYWGPPNERFEQFLRVPRRIFPGARVFGKAIYSYLLSDGFDPALVDGDFVFDENFCVPLSLLTPVDALPLVPVVVNGVNPPYPTLRRCYALGRAIGEAISADRIVERVVVLATGGLSHWVGMPQSGTINREFDRAIIDAVSAGEVEAVLNLSDAELDEAGNGAHEIRALLVLWGALGDALFEVLAYEAVPEWLTGIWIASCTSSSRMTRDRLTVGANV